MHMVVINSLSGVIMWALVFDTYESSIELDDFIKNDLPNGLIIVVACKDDCF